MSTIDLTQVSGLRAVDAEGNDLGPVSLQDLTDSITTKVLQTLSMRQQATTLEEPALLSASAQAAGSDTFENQLPQQSDLKWARALDASGNSILISKEDLAGVVGGLLGIDGHSFQSVSIIIQQGEEYELPFQSGLLLITNQSGSTKMAAATLSEDGTGKVINDEETQVVFFSKTGGLSTVSVYKEGQSEHWKIINNRSLQAQIRYSYIINT